MQKHIAISVLGKDKPGIVAAVSKVLFQSGCNIEDSSMTLLQSEFAMILIVALGPKSGLNTLRSRFDSVSKNTGMTISLRELSSKESIKEKPSKNNCIISVYGADKPGIVYKVSDILARNRINITDVQTSISGKGDKSSYIMLLETSFPSPASISKVKRKLEALSDSMDIKISLNVFDTPQL